MIKSSLYFNYAGRDSLEFNIINGSVDNAELKENFLANKKIKEINTIEADKPYFQGIERNPLQLKLQFCFTEKWNKELIREVARWLHQDNYQPLYFSEDPEKIYYAMPVDDVEMTHFGLEQGYLDITMRCNTYHAYSREYLSETYDLSENNEDGTEIIIPNYGDIDIKPDIWIKKISDGSLEITNRSNSGEVTSFCNGSSGKGILKFTGTVFDSEIVTIGDKIFEFDTGDGIVNENVKQWTQGFKYIDGTIVNKSGILYQCIKTNTDEEWDENHWKKLEKSNIKVDVSADANPAQAKLVFNNTPIEDNDNISIGNNVYEFDFDDVYEAKNGHIPISLKNYTTQANGRLIARSNLDFAGSKIKVGDREYEITASSNEGVAITKNTGLKGWRNWRLDSYFESDSDFKDATLLINEKRDNTLDGVRIPLVSDFVNNRIDKEKQIIELFKLTKFLGIPAERYADTGKFQPVSQGIKGQDIGDELSIYKRTGRSFKIDMINSTSNKFYINKMFQRNGVTDKNMEAKIGDIILITKWQENRKNDSFVEYEGKEYIQSDFELLRIKNVGETKNNSLILTHESGTYWYELETPSKIFKTNPLYSYGEGKRVVGSGYDLANAKIVLNGLGFSFVDSKGLSEENLRKIVRNGDIILGEKGAKGGIPFDIDGAIRLGGSDRYETAKLVRDYYWEIHDKYYAKGYDYYYNVILFTKQGEKLLIQEDIPLTRPYQIRMGSSLDETCENIVKAINEEGRDWVEYSKGTYEHDDVRAEYDKSSKIINIKAKERGSKGNKISSVVNDWENTQKLLRQNYKINQFEFPNLVKGKDAIYSELDDTNGKSLIAYITDVLKTNEDKMNISFSNNTINIISKKYGSINNIIPVLSNCYSCNFYDIKDNPAVTLEGGKDPSVNTILQALYSTIDNVFCKMDLENQTITVTHKEVGKKTNINISTTAINAYWDNGKKLYGGRDGLVNDEEIYIEGESGYIESNKNKGIVDVYNGNDLVLKYGENRLLIKGNCFIRFKTKYKFL
ncbi:distal tail protein Dit [Clostridium botulinum]|uniref:distal tail protein Dit n=1 Tax=Clostridium botulinum TaxID=1491 RepID=UPI001969FD3B|nr:distal tail protein Dit [Clostridium botulinum]MBN3451404.1 hypothetical protein [Clostridium botulinum]